MIDQQRSDPYDTQNGSVPEPRGHGSPEMLQAELAELFWFMARTAETGVFHADMGDREGMIYAARRIAAYLRALKPTLLDWTEPGA